MCAKGRESSTTQRYIRRAPCALLGDWEKRRFLFVSATYEISIGDDEQRGNRRKFQPRGGVGHEENIRKGNSQA